MSVTDIQIEPGYRWAETSRDGWRVFWVENINPTPDTFDGFPPDGSIDIERLATALRARKGFFGLIAESATHVVAAVDRIRSFPVFCGGSGETFRISNAARPIRDALGLEKSDPVGVVEFQLSGWVSGEKTVLEGLSQLQAGEYLVYDKSSHAVLRDRYYLFYSARDTEGSEDELVARLDALHDRQYRAIAERAKGRPIWIPLSGGWDSRLIASKLAQIGYPNIQTFSYGTPGNHETRLARDVARVLDLPWFEVPVTGKEYRQYYWSPARKAYFDYSDGLCALPFMQDSSIVASLLAQGRMPRDAIVINGQSGDFITGGHIQPELMGADIDLDRVLDTLLAHHYRMWLNLRTPENMRVARAHMAAILADLRAREPSMPYGAKMTECWEWQERQSKFVVNGQRAYDFCDLDWELPLWEPEYLDFWQAVPIAMKFKQSLYKKCLRENGYRDIFNAVSTEVWRWPGASIAIVPVARLFGLLMGSGAKERIYKTFKWMGHYRYSYAAFGYWKAMQTANIVRDPDSFNIEVWSRENGLPDPLSYAAQGTPA